MESVMKHVQQDIGKIIMQVFLFVLLALQLSQDAQNVMKVMEQHVLFVNLDSYTNQIHVLMPVIKKIGTGIKMCAMNVILLV